MKSKLIFTFSLFLINGLIFAQGLVNSEGQPTTDFGTNMMNNGVWVSTSSRLNDPVEGSPYLFNNFFNKSEIHFENDVYSIHRLNYNLKTEQFEAQISEDSIFILNTRFIKKIVMNEKVLEPYFNAEEGSLTFYENIGTFDNQVLLKGSYLTVIEGRIDPMTKVKVGTDRYKINEKFYIGDAKGNIVKEIKLKKSKVLELFSPKAKNELATYVKENKLKLSDIGDVLRLIQHYNLVINKSN